jgi:hypothetical protein
MALKICESTKISYRHPEYGHITEEFGGCGLRLQNVYYEDKHGKKQAVTVCRVCDAVAKWPAPGLPEE